MCAQTECDPTGINDTNISDDFRMQRYENASILSSAYLIFLIVPSFKN
jgi:hypothetical protein